MEDINTLFKKNLVGMIAAAIMATLGMVIDGIVIAHFMGTDATAAYGLVTPLTNLVMMCSGILATGTQIICARHIGAKDKASAKKAFSMCMLITFILAVVIMAALLIFRSQISVLLGASGDAAHLAAPASDYILGMLFSVPFVFYLLEFNGLMRLDGDPNRIITAVILMTVLDISGDFLNVLVFNGGMLGMGLTTSVSYFAAFLLMLTHFRRKDIIFRFSFKGLSFSILKDIIFTGSSSAVGSGSAMLRTRVLNGLMLKSAFAIAATAALSVLNTILNFTSCVMVGMGMTCSLIAGLISGTKDEQAACTLVKTTSKYALITGAVLFVILFPFAPMITRIFAGNSAMAEMAARGLRIYSAGLLLYSLNTAFINYTQGMRRIAISNIFCFLENFLFIVLPALALFGILDADAVWAAFPIAELMTFISIFGFAAVKKKGLPVKFKDYTFMKGSPADSGAAGGKYKETIK